MVGMATSSTLNVYARQAISADTVADEKSVNSVACCTVLLQKLYQYIFIQTHRKDPVLRHTAVSNMLGSSSASPLDIFINVAGLLIGSHYPTVRADLYGHRKGK